MEKTCYATMFSPSFGYVRLFLFTATRRTIPDGRWALKAGPKAEVLPAGGRAAFSVAEFELPAIPWPALTY